MKTGRICLKNSALTALTLLTLLMSACAMPRVTVMDDPLAPAEHLRLGIAYESENNLTLAEQHLKDATRGRPDAWFFLGNVYFRQERYDDAEKAYHTAIAKQPASAEARNNLAWLLYIRKKDLGAAERLAQEAVAMARQGAEGNGAAQQPQVEPAESASRLEVYEDTLERIREALRTAQP